MNDDLTLARPDSVVTKRYQQSILGLCEGPKEQEFVQMVRAFRRTGGIGHGDDIARHLSKYADQPISVVARWIVNREAVAFGWNCQTLLPLFQFDPVSMELRPGVAAILRELSDVFDNWGCALWFAQPNAWLADSLPVDLVNTDARQVLDAARVDRFIARG